MLVFSKNKYISRCIKVNGKVPPDDFWVDDFDGKEVKQINEDGYQQVGGYGWHANKEWVAEVDDKYFKRRK